jgi:mycothiol system anti-sigma-R factor
MSEMDCNEVLERLWAYLDGEADATICVDLQIHIEECLHCRQQADFEVRLRRLIQSKCRGERAPQTLRAQLARMLRMSL